jgi:hypothetical protein
MEGVIALCIPVAAFIMVWGIRYLQNRENMAMIERGLDPHTKKRQRDADPTQTLKNALMFIGAGLGLLIAMTLVKSWNLTGSERTATYFGLIAILGGSGMLLAYLYERKNPPPTPRDF